MLRPRCGSPISEVNMRSRNQHLLLVTLLCLSLPGISASPSLQPATAAQDIYTDALAAGMEQLVLGHG